MKADDEKDHIIYVLEFKRVSDTGQEYVTETQKPTEAQHRNSRTSETV